MTSAPVTRATRWFPPVRQMRLDRSTMLALATQGVALAAGPVTAIIIATRFSPTLQGFYYSFSSVLSLQALAEMGLSATLIALGSRAQTQDARGGEQWHGSDSAYADGSLSDLARGALVWSLASAALFLVTITAGGVIIFSRQSAGVSWLAPWVAVCLLTTINLALIPVFALAQAVGDMASYWFYRLIQQIVNAPVLWLSIWLGGNLWTNAIAAAASAAWSVTYIVRRYQPIVRIFSLPGNGRLRWFRDVWPLQWRTALNWLSSYAVTLLLPAVAFALLGPVSAGRTGLTVALSSVLFALGTSAIVTKAPLFGKLAARHKFRELKLQFRRALTRSLSITVVGGAAVWCGVVVVHLLHLGFAHRILGPLPAGLLLGGTVLSIPVFAFGVFLRALRVDPLAILAAGTAAGALLLACLLGRVLGEGGMAAGYLVAAAIQVVVARAVLTRTLRETIGHPSGGPWNTA
jgi:hypothetical protein